MFFKVVGIYIYEERTMETMERKHRGVVTIMMERTKKDKIHIEYERDTCPG